MISIKGGTKTWSEAPQTTSDTPKQAMQMTPEEKEQFFGGEDVGNVLNKISDPNWVDPAKKARRVGKNELDKDAFLNLLLTQMKNQDPTNPLKSHEMAAQLAQFTSLEKLTNIDDGIAKLTRAQEPTTRFEALNFIGKTVSVDTSKIVRSQDTGGHEIGFKLPSDAQKVDFKILDANGETIRTLSVPSLAAGKNEVYWNGGLEDGTPAPIGEYQVEIEAIGTNGNKIHAETKLEGQITGVNYTATGPVLMAGKQQIAMKDVTTIIDPNLEAKANAQQPTVTATAAALKGEAIPKQMKGDTEEAVAAPKVKPQSSMDGDEPKENVHKGNNLQQLGMSQEMINRLQKEGIQAGM